jgi:hypothetical protein
VDCERRYYWTYYGSYWGWAPDAPPLVRRSFALKHLMTLSMALGAAIHRRARDCARAVRTGEPLPTYEDLLAPTRDDLNRIHRLSLHPNAFLQDPARHPMLREVWYGSGIRGADVEWVGGRMRRCLRSLLASPVWEDVRQADPKDILVIDSPCQFILGGVPLYAAPDLLYRRRSGVWVIVDWKTGREQDASAQLGVYAAYLEHGVGITVEPGRVLGRVCYLDSGEEYEEVLTRADLDAAEASMQTSVSWMRGFLVDPEQNAPRDIDAFTCTSQSSRCLGCNFQELCLPASRPDELASEVEEQAPAPAGV